MSEMRALLACCVLAAGHQDFHKGREERALPEVREQAKRRKAEGWGTPRMTPYARLVLWALAIVVVAVLFGWAVHHALTVYMHVGML